MDQCRIQAIRPRHDEDFGPQAAHRDELQALARGSGVLGQIRNDLSRLYPEQVLPRPLDLPLGDNDGEQVYVSGDNVEHVSSMVEQPRTPAVKRYATWRLRRHVRRDASLRRPEQSIRHCWATSWA